MRRMFRPSEEDYCPPPKQAKVEVHKRGLDQNRQLACSVCVTSNSPQLKLDALLEKKQTKQLKLGFETAGSWLTSSDNQLDQHGFGNLKLWFEIVGSWLTSSDQLAVQHGLAG